MTTMDDIIAVKMPWQDEQWHRIVDLHHKSRLPHAVLLAGEPGTGKHRFALSLCHYLMCQSPVSELACGKCRQCQLLASGAHPDLKWLVSEEKSKQIKVGQVRAVVDFLAHTSQQGGFKIAVVAPAEEMNINAANALLKSLEEPAENTLLLLISDSPGQLLPTIRSRCQKVSFPVPPQALSLQWLETVVSGQIDKEHLLREASGQPLTALSMLSNDGLERRRHMNDDYQAMLEGRTSPLGVAAGWLGYDLGEILGWLNKLLSELVKIKMSSEPSKLDGKSRAAWDRIVQKVDTRMVFALQDSVQSVIQSLARGGNPNQQLVLEQLLLESCEKFNS